MAVRRLVQVVTAGCVAYLLVARPWEHWGASAEEARAPQPADDPGTPTWYRASWAFILRPAGSDATRLIVRWRHQLAPFHPSLGRVTEFALLAGHAFMSRKQLRGIRQRAQAAVRPALQVSAVSSGGPGGTPLGRFSGGQEQGAWWIRGSISGWFVSTVR